MFSEFPMSLSEWHVPIITTISFPHQYFLHNIFNCNQDPCETIRCNGTNAQCQVYLGGENKGKPFCACPQGLVGDPGHDCGKHFKMNDEQS